MRPSLSKLRRTSPTSRQNDRLARPSDASAQEQDSSETQTTVFQTLPTAVFEEIVTLLVDQGCGSIGYMAICNTSKEFKQICQDQVLWERRCRERGWGERPSPMRTWFAHYLCKSCISYRNHMDEMLQDAAQRGDVARVAAALAWGADPTRNERILRYTIAATRPTLEEYANAKGDMLGVVKLLLQFGPPPPYAVRESLNWTLRSTILDDDYQPQSEHDKLYLEFISKPSYEVASLLFDYIEETQYALWDTYQNNIRIYKDMLRSVLRSGDSAKALRLLLQKVPLLAQQSYTPDGFDAYQEAPYGFVIGRTPTQVSHRMIEALLDYNFPTVLLEEEEASFMRFATIVAAVEGDCRALEILHSHGAPFPTLTLQAQEALLERIEERRQEKEEEESSDESDDSDSEGEEESEGEGSDMHREESLCDMPTYLRQLGLLS